MNIIEKLRLYRIDGIALFDLIGTFFIAFMIDLIFNFKNKLTYYFMLLPLGILVHLLVNQKTFLNSKLFTKEFNKYHIFSIIYIIMYIVLILRTR